MADEVKLQPGWLERDGELARLRKAEMDAARERMRASEAVKNWSAFQ